MKSLIETIRESSLENGPVKYGQILSEDYAVLEQILGKNCGSANVMYTIDPHDTLELRYSNAVWENLNSNSTDLVEKYIEQYFSNNVAGFYDMTIPGKDLRSFLILFRTETDRDLVKNDIRLKWILEFFNYFVGEIKEKPFSVKNGGPEYYTILVEPNFTNIVPKDFTYRNIYYHFCPIEYWDNISKKGLRCSGNSGELWSDNMVKIPDVNMRNFPKRVYLFGINQTPNSIDFLSKDVMDFIHLNIQMSENGIAVIKVDLNRVKIPVYIDPVVKNGNAAFTFNSIPPERLELFRVIRRDAEGRVLIEKP